MLEFYFVTKNNRLLKEFQEIIKQKLNIKNIIYIIIAEVPVKINLKQSIILEIFIKKVLQLPDLGSKQKNE
jgi:hypothetical protein